MSYYDDYEVSTRASDILECYLFRVSGRTWLWTSSDAIVDLPNVGRFEPHPIRRSEVGENGEDSAGQVRVTVPVTNPVAQLFIGLPPTEPVTLDLYRAQHAAIADWRRIWTGEIDQMGTDLVEATLVGLPASFQLREVGPGVVYGPTCSRQLFSATCGALRALFTDTAYVTAIDGADVFADEFDAKPDGWYLNGIVQSADLPQRGVVLHSGTMVRLSSPMPGLQVGDQVLITAGCDGLYSTCDSKFDNAPNHYGWERIPTRDPRERMV